MVGIRGDGNWVVEEDRDGYCASKIQSHAAVNRDPSVTQGASCPSSNGHPPDNHD